MVRRAIWFFIVLLGLVRVNALAQSLSFKNYSVNNKLPSSTIYAAFQDSKGFMWFGSDKGVVRYDGYNFISFSQSDGLADNEVIDFFEDSRGRLWFYSLNGRLSYYTEGSIINSHGDTTLRSLDSDSYITSIAEDSVGNIWIATLKDGLLRLSPTARAQRFKFTQEPLRYLHGVFPMTDGTVTLVTSEGVYGVTITQGNSKVDNIEPLILDNRIKSVHIKSIRLNKDELVICTYGAVARVNIPNKSSEVLLIRKSGSIFNVTADKDFIWICTSDGVVPYSIKEGKVQTKALEGERVSTVKRDYEGNYWFTTFGTGIYFRTASLIYGYTTNDGLAASNVSCMAIDTLERLWLGYGTKGIVSYIKNKTISSFPVTHEAEISGIAINRIRFSKDKIWILIPEGVVILENGRKTQFQFPARDLIENNGKVFVAGGHGLGIFTREFVDQHKIPALLSYADRHRVNHRLIGLPTKMVNPYEQVSNLYRDRKSQLWASSANHLYKIMDNDSLVLADIDVSGASAAVTDFAEMDDGTLVMTTKDQGVIFVAKDSISVIGAEQGLSSNICTTVAIDKNNVMWIGSNNGVSRVSGYPDKIEINHISSEDGLLSNDVSDILIHQDTVWIGTKGGLNFFSTDQFYKKTSTVPRMHIEAFTVDGERMSYDRREPIELKYNQDNINIKYVGLSYSDGGNILYRYKIDDDDHWQYTRNTTLSFPKLPPGNYSFRISARGRADMWSNEVAVIFVIRKPFWQTFWFVSVVIVFAIAIVALTTIFYFKQQRKKLMMEHRITLSELRSLRAQMNPHFLFNALNSIKAIMMKGSMVIAEDYLTRFGKMMRTILDHSDKTTISIAEEVESLKNYLEIEQLRASHPFHYTISIDPAIDEYNTEIPVMIIQPFVENALWHGFGHGKQDDTLWLSFKEADNFLVITIKDNGVGRKRAMALKARSHKSKGMQLVKERIDIINAGSHAKIELSIHDLEDEQGNHPGTSVIIKIPL